MNTYDIAYTSSVITENCFNVVKRHLNTGVMATHEWIVKKAILFEEEHKEVSEWDEYLSTKINDKSKPLFSDWEEYLLFWIGDQMQKELSYIY